MKAFIFLNGEYNYKKNFFKNDIKINENDCIFCADGGANYTYKNEIKVDFIIGDLDSIDENVLNYYAQNNTKIEKYPEDKDFTDFELILMKIKKIEKENNINFEKINIFGGLGKRIDMTLSNLNLMEEYKNIVFFNEDEIIFFKDKSFELKNMKDFIFSIILLDKKVEKLTLKGFKYELDRVTLERKKSRLVSNKIVDSVAEIKFDKGKMIIILKKE